MIHSSAYEINQIPYYSPHMCQFRKGLGTRSFVLFLFLPFDTLLLGTANHNPSQISLRTGVKALSSCCQGDKWWLTTCFHKEGAVFEDDGKVTLCAARSR